MMLDKMMSSTEALPATKDPIEGATAAAPKADVESKATVEAPTGHVFLQLFATAPRPRGLVFDLFACDIWNSFYWE